MKRRIFLYGLAGALVLAISMFWQTHSTLEDSTSTDSPALEMETADGHLLTSSERVAKEASQKHRASTETDSIRDGSVMDPPESGGMDRPDLNETQWQDQAWVTLMRVLDETEFHDFHVMAHDCDGYRCESQIQLYGDFSAQRIQKLQVDLNSKKDSLWPENEVSFDLIRVKKQSDGFDFTIRIE